MGKDPGLTRRLPLLPREEGLEVVRSDDERRLPILRGNGRWTYLCGQCGATLAEGLVNEHLHAILECPECQRWNDPRPER